MNTAHTSAYNYNQKQANHNGNISKIEAFIISRIGELKEVGWSTAAIADALGVNTDFVEKAVQLYRKSWG